MEEKELEKQSTNINDKEISFILEKLDMKNLYLI
jgi:hypothetical protein